MKPLRLHLLAVVFVWVVAGWFMPLSASGQPFRVQTVATLGNGPSSSPHRSAVGDLDGDGDLDIVTATRSSVRVLLRQADGSFVARPAIALGDQPQDVALGDMDGDGDLDLVTCNVAWGPGTVRVLLQQPDGSFTAQPLIPVGLTPNRLVLGDLDGDGDLDVALPNGDDFGVDVLFQQSDRTFIRVPLSLGIGNRPVDLALGDLDGDGDLDLVTTNSYGLTGTVSALMQQRGSFTLEALGSVGGEPTGLTIGDLDGDGDLDLGVAVSNSQGSSLSLLLRAADGTYPVQTTLPTPGGYPHGLVVDDLNGDGLLDLATLAGDTVRVAYRQPGGDYGVESVGSLGDNPLHLTVGDLDGDGDPDLIVTNDYSDDLSVLLRQPDGSYTAQRAGDAGSAPSGVVTGDFDGDGDSDLATVNVGSNDIGLLVRQPGARYTTERTGSLHKMPFDLVAADLDADGDLDLATVSTQGISVSYQQAGGFLTRSVGALGGWPILLWPIGLAVGDLDGDGDLDLINTNHEDNSVSRWFRQPDGSYVGPSPLAVGRGPYAVTVADLDGDGDLDLATANGGSHDVTLLLRQPDGRYRLQTAGTVGDDPIRLVTGDLDGDGDLDLAVLNYSLGPGTVDVLLRQDDSSYVVRTAGTVGRGAFGLALGDLDGDGDLDLVTANLLSDDVSLLFRQSDGSYGVQTVSGVGDGPMSIAVGDLDGDGDLDLALANSQDGTVSILFNQRSKVAVGDGSGSRPTRFGLRPAAPNPFNPTTRIGYTLPAEGPVTLRVYDVLGREVATLVDGVQSAGAHTATFDGAGLASGVYLVRLVAGRFSQTERILLAK